MRKLKTKEEPEIKFDEVEYQCRCGQKGRKQHRSIRHNLFQMQQKIIRNQNF